MVFLMRLGFILLCLSPGLLAACSNAFFYPQRPLQLTPARVGLDYRDIYLDSSDGTRLHAWYLPAQGESKGAILFLHGNAGNISTHLSSVYWLPAAHYDVFLLDYRGYGASAGSVSIDGSLQDVEAGIGWLSARAAVRERGMVVFGQSLGGALAVYAVANSRHRSAIKALIIDSAFSSYRGIAREKLAGFWLTWPLQWPLSLTVSDTYSPLAAIGKVSPIPVLILHAEHDSIIPLRHAERLYAAAKEPKSFWRINEGGHIAALTQETYRQRFKNYLDNLFDAASGSGANVAE
jgi:fermentation-respiration switch protein FrsA (DUF1100 family)